MGRFAAMWAALLVLGACEAGSVESGVVNGVVKLGPTMPVCREGVPCDGVYKGAKVELRSPGGQVIARTTADEFGVFRLEVAAGRYDATVDVEGPLPRCTPASLSISAGQTVHVEIDCDSGIR